MTARPGDVVALDRARFRRRCAAVAAAGFAAGLLVASLGGGNTYTVHAEQSDRKVSSTLIGVGQSLCRDFRGLKNITRLDAKRYRFECGEWATFDKVPVTVGE